MKIVFLGTGEFAVPSLEAAHKAGHSIALVVSQPDRPQGRGLTLRPTAVKAAAERLGLPVFQPEKLRLDPDRVVVLRADALVVVAYGQILRENILECARLGALNVHASLLPKYRGAAPIQWAIANGETHTGVTTMQLDRGMDTGPILLQEGCDVGPEDTAATLEPRLATLGASLLVQTLEGLAAGTLTPRAQDEATATKAPLIRKSDGVIDFEPSAAEISNRLRGFFPWPGLQFQHEGRAVKVLAALPRQAHRSASISAGEILSVSRDGVDVACGAGSALRLLRVQPESRAAMTAFDFANGAKLRPGSVFGPASGSRPVELKD
ncbi:MAG: methionyl-tRNA formyltransferase [Vicinamibacteria bacterium]